MSCVIACAASSQARSIVESLKREIASKDISFVWTCEFTLSMSGKASNVDHIEGVVALGVTGLHIFRLHDVKQSDRESFSLESSSIERTETRCVDVHVPPAVVRIRFPTTDIMERFVSVFASVAKDQDQNTTRHERSSSITSSATIRSTDTGKSGRNKDNLADILLHSADTDYFHVGSNKHFCVKARHKWQKWTSRVKAKNNSASDKDYLHFSEADSSKGMDRGQSSVQLSVDAQLSLNTHELVVVTETALYVVKRRDPGQVKVFLPVAGIEAIQMASTEKTLAGGEIVTEWDIMLVIDLQIPVTTVSTDVRFTLDTRSKNLFLATVSRRFEALRLLRLPVSIQDGIDKLFWRKRTLVETKIMRFANKIKSGILMMGREASRSISTDEDLAVALRDVITDNTEAFVHTLCWQSVSSTKEDADELGFFARSLLGAARCCGVVREVIQSAVSFEVDRIVINSESATSAKRPLPGFFRSRSLVDFIIQEHCMHSGEQYLRVQLSQMIEEFTHSTTGEGFSGATDDDYLRYVRELGTILFESLHNDALFPEQLREVMAMIEVAVERKESKIPSNVFLTDDFVAHNFIGRAIAAPQSNGLVSDELTITQLQSLQQIALLFEKLANAPTGKSGWQLWLHDPSQNNTSNISTSERFKTMAERVEPQVHEFVRRLISRQLIADTTSRYDVLHNHSRRMRNTGSSVVARAPIVESDIRVLKSFHTLLERRCSGLLGAAYRRVVVSDASTNAAGSPLSIAARNAQQDEIASLKHTLAVAEKSVEHVKQQWAYSAANIEELKLTLQSKDDELMRLRRALREYDPKFLPSSSSGDAMANVGNFSPPSMLQEEPHSPSTMMYQHCLGSNAHGYRSVMKSRPTFGCPLDSYAICEGDYSPR